MVLSIMFALVFGILTETTEDDEDEDEDEDVTKKNLNNMGKFLKYIMAGSLVLSVVFMVTFVISFVVFIFSN